MSKSNFTSVELLYKNKLIENIYEACTCCYDNTKDIDYMEKKEYIRKRVEAGHESVLEHGRLAILIKNIIKPSRISSVVGYDFSKWLEFYTAELEDGTYNMIINGSIRAYKHFINNITPYIYETDAIARQIIKILELNTPRELWGKAEDFVIEDFMNNHSFIDAEPDVQDISFARAGMRYDCIEDKVLDTPKIISKDNKATKSVTVAYDVLHMRETETIPDMRTLLHIEGFSDDVYENIIPIMVEFKNMSRTATHQLVRHRNAITQESQRYVSAENATFTIPMEDYEEKKIYNISIFGSSHMGSLTDLASELLSIYKQLIQQGLKKEEARAFLPSNVNCGRLYMTFTIASLKKFLQLRTDPHAQYEIRQYALAIESMTKDKIINY